MNEDGHRDRSRAGEAAFQRSGGEAVALVLVVAYGAHLDEEPAEVLQEPDCGDPVYQTHEKPHKKEA